MKKTQTAKGLKYWGRLLVLVLCVHSLFLTTSVTPVFAQGIPVTDPLNAVQRVKMWAQRNADWLKALGYIGKIITAIAEVTATVSDWMDKIIKDLHLTTAVKTAAQQATVENDGKLTQAIVDAGVQNVALGVIVGIAADSALPRHEALCRSILSHMLPLLSAGDYPKEVSRFALSMIESRYLGDTADGSGPQYARDSFWARYKQKFCGADYPSGCSGTSTTGTDGRSLADADFSFFTLDGGQKLEMTHIKSESKNGVTYSYPDPQNTEQKFWVAGLYYCYNMAGGRPTPAAGEKMLYPGSMARRSFWDTLASKESDFAKPCTDLLAYYTRPNSEATTALEEQKKNCLAAKRQGVDVSAFDNCEKGLSPYEAEKLDLLICKANQFYLSHAQAGASEPDMMKSIDKCTKAWQAWNTYRQIKISAVTEGAIGLARMKKLWAKTETVTTTGMKQPANDDSHPKREASLKEQAKPVVDSRELRQIKGSPAHKGVPSGEPVAADEIAWPQAVAQ